MRSRALTPTQRKIVWLMRQHGTAQFALTPKRGRFRYLLADNGLLLIGAYQTPQWFLRSRGIIETVGDIHPPHYRLTKWGEELASGIREMPR